MPNKQAVLCHQNKAVLCTKASCSLPNIIRRRGLSTPSSQNRAMIGTPPAPHIVLSTDEGHRQECLCDKKQAVLCHNIISQARASQPIKPKSGI